MRSAALGRFRAADADVVDAFHDDDVRDAGLGEDVAIEAGEGATPAPSPSTRLPAMPRFSTPSRTFASASRRAR